MIEVNGAHTVLKYVFHSGVSKQCFELPKETIVRAFGVQTIAGVPHLVFWAEVKSHISATENRTFQIVATGEPFSVMSTYYGSAQMGSYIFHLYEVF